MNLIEELALITKCDKSRSCIDNTACNICEPALERSKNLLPIFAEWIKGIEPDKKLISSVHLHGFLYCRDFIVSELEKMK
jgi:hypothetical protein